MKDGTFDIARRGAVGLVLMCVLLGGMGPTAASAQEQPLSAAKLRVINDVAAGTLGNNVDFDPAAAAYLQLGTTKIRQIAYTDHGDKVHIHYLNHFDTDPDGVLLLSQDKTSNTVIAYRVDLQFHFIRGYTSINGQLTPLSDADGAAGVQAELVLWNRCVDVEMADIRKRLKAHEKADVIVKDYGVPVATLKHWVKTVK